MAPRARKTKPVVDYFRQAQQIAFAPMTFQALRVARDKGLLAAINDSGQAGLAPEEVAAKCGISRYAARVLLEACASVDALELRDGHYRLAPTGKVLLHDKLVRINMDFCNDVCYQGAFHLEEALVEGRPAGLKVFGDWPTIYAGLLELPPRALKSWLEFDHVYSDGVFPKILPEVFKRPVKTLLDVGGNTGKWALYSLKQAPGLHVTLLDHPAQIAKAEENLTREGLNARASFLSMDMLDHSKDFPKGFDAVWMCQFLDCFSEKNIVQLLRRGREALGPEGRLHIIETYWDRQPHLPARDAILGTSLYFASMANGDSRMYHSNDMVECAREAGLTVERECQAGFHTLFVCRPSEAEIA